LIHGRFGRNKFKRSQNSEVGWSENLLFFQGEILSVWFPVNPAPSICSPSWNGSYNSWLDSPSSLSLEQNFKEDKLVSRLF